MTNGSSQGLFVIVAVVIFGIFVSISYILFIDSLQPSLANIFEDSTNISLLNLSDSKITEFSNSVNSKYRVLDNGEVEVYDFFYQHTGTKLYSAGPRLNTRVEIPWNHKILISYDVFIEGDDEVIQAAFDLNSFPDDDSKAWSTNDNYGTFSVKTNMDMYRGKKIELNKWNTIHLWYANDNPLNKDKVPIYEGYRKKSGEYYGSILGVQTQALINNNIESFKIKNVKYKVVPM